MVELSDPGRLRSALENVGFADVRIVEETRDFPVTPEMLNNPDQLFSFSPVWPVLSQGQRERALQIMRSDGGVLAVPSTALIATARRLHSIRM